MLELPQSAQKLGMDGDNSMVVVDLVDDDNDDDDFNEDASLDPWCRDDNPIRKNGCFTIDPEKEVARKTDIKARIVMRFGCTMPFMVCT